MQDGKTKLVIADYHTAPIDERLRAMLGLLEKVTLHPDAVTPVDVRSVLALGVTREQVRDALYVAFLFNTYDRLADALGWAIPGQRYFTKAGKFLLKAGYR
jgi:alkylhydroperoxidase family enzyme